MRLFCQSKPRSRFVGLKKSGVQKHRDAPQKTRLKLWEFATPCSRSRARIGLLGLVFFWLPIASFAADSVAQVQATARESQLHCELQYGGNRQTLLQAASPDPYSAQTVVVADRFGFKASVLGRADDIRSISLSVRDLKAAGSPVVQQSRWSAPFIATGDSISSLTGWQTVYSSVLGREFRYGCALRDGIGAAGASSSTEVQRLVPHGWASVDTDEVVRLAFVGDVMLADRPGRTIAHGGDPFKHVASLLRSADLRIANLECVIAANGKAVDKPWTFLARPSVLPVLKRNIDIVSVANNHSGDFGTKAFAEMLDRLQKADLPNVGGGLNLRQAHQPLLVQRKGVRIALLAYDHFFPRRFEAGDHSPGVAWADEEQMAYDVSIARQKADVVISFMHWGQEDEPIANVRQRELARLLIDAGADAVVGSHPHVVQDAETYRGKPIIYSLGNFVFDGFKNALNNTGAILWLDVTARGVKRWHTSAVQIDRNGTPHPARQPIDETHELLPR